MKIIKTTTLIAICLIGISCKKDSLKKNGNVLFEERNLSGFETISTDGSNPVQIKYGSNFKVVIKGSENLLPHYQTKVVGKNLQFGFDKSNVKNDDIEVFITLPTLGGIKVNGSSKVDITGNFPIISQMDIISNGSAKITAIDNFRIENLSVNMSGSGRLKFENALAINSNINLSGSGSIYVAAESKLKVSISGSGNVSYRGNPILETQLSGSGKVIKI